MIPTKNDMEIWVHVSPDQQVWFGTSTHPAVNSKLEPGDFADQEWVQSGQAIRILGDWDNAELIMRLWNAKITHGLPLKIYLAKPQRQAIQADETVSWMRQLAMPPSCGGWHEMTTADYPAYGLISVMQQMEGQKPTELMTRLLQAHPAYPALSFLPKTDWFWAATLLSFIGDPRWHVDPVHPDRSSAYYWFLGLGRTESAHWAWQAYLRHPVEPISDYRRVATVVETWAPPGILHKGNAEAPNAFLQRIALDNGDAARGILAASRVFARFVRDVWLDRLTPRREYRQVRTIQGKSRTKLKPAQRYNPQLFVPEHFFDDVRTVHAWQAHVNRAD